MLSLSQIHFTQGAGFHEMAAVWSWRALLLPGNWLCGTDKAGPGDCSLTILAAFLHEAQVSSQKDPDRVYTKWASGFRAAVGVIFSNSITDWLTVGESCNNPSHLYIESASFSRCLQDSSYRLFRSIRSDNILKFFIFFSTIQQCPIVKCLLWWGNVRYRMPRYFSNFSVNKKTTGFVVFK